MAVNPKGCRLLIDRDLALFDSILILESRGHASDPAAVPTDPKESAAASLNSIPTRYYSTMYAVSFIATSRRLPRLNARGERH
jgi:hypothetical protein